MITLGHQNLKSMNIWLKCTCMSLWLPVIFLMHFVTETPLSQWGFERGAWKWCTCSFHCGKHEKINAKKIKLLVLVYTCINPVFFKIFTLYIGKNTGTVGGIWSACEQVTSLSWGHRPVIVNLWCCLEVCYVKVKYMYPGVNSQKFHNIRRFHLSLQYDVKIRVYCLNNQFHDMSLGMNWKTCVLTYEIKKENF